MHTHGYLAPDYKGNKLAEGPIIDLAVNTKVVLCRECDTEFSSLGAGGYRELKDHFKANHKGKDAMCWLCPGEKSRTFASWKRLADHLFWGHHVHPEAFEEVQTPHEIWCISQTFTCSFCSEDAHYSGSRSFVNHLARVHGEVQLFSCQECDKQFYREQGSVFARALQHFGERHLPDEDGPVTVFQRVEERAKRRRVSSEIEDTARVLTTLASSGASQSNPYV